MSFGGRMEKPDSGQRETARLEAFSDGVFAIAITLLALELRIPHGTPGERLGHELLDLWPTYLAFVTSFAIVGIMWLNHHRLFTLIGRVDHRLMVINLVLLLGVTTVGFPTALVAQYLGHPGEREAVIAYQLAFILCSIGFNFLWRHISSPHHDPPILRVPHDHPEVVDIRAAYRWGPYSYLPCLALAFWNPTVSVALNLALAVFWAYHARPTHERRSQNAPHS